MKTDSIFYRLFKTFPEAFFELVNQSTTIAEAYDFASVELKQTAFRIDRRKNSENRTQNKDMKNGNHGTRKMFFNRSNVKNVLHSE